MWAYTWDPEFKGPPADDVLHRMPGSTAAFSFKQARDLFFSPDWHPDDHPAMPEVVARGRKPDVRACGSCHRAEGTGGPENSSLAGLPAAYIVQQMPDYKSGARKFAGPRRAPSLLMVAAAKAATDAEVQATADYFSALKLKPIIKVVETDAVPKTYVARNVFVISKTGGTEPLGQRVVEVPVDGTNSSFVTHDRSSWHTCRLGVSQRAKPSLRLVVPARPRRARSVMARTSKVLARYPGLPVARRAMPCASSTTSNMAREQALEVPL